MDNMIPLYVGSFLFILAVLVLLRSRKSRFEIKPADIGVAVLPIIVFLLATGQLQEFDKPSMSTIASQVTPLVELPFEPLRGDTKAEAETNPAANDQKTEGLLFRMNHGGYFGSAIEASFDRLARQPSFKYLLIENPDGSFFAIADARELSALFQAQRPEYTASDFADWLNLGEKESLSRLPGFTGSRDGVNQETDRGLALQKMETLNTDTLPVVDQNRRFTGIVNRSNLTASLIVDGENTAGEK